MPSGAKRRKAAKKKKEILDGNSSTTNPQGDEKGGSDGGQIGSEHVLQELRPVAEGKSVDGDSSDAEAAQKDGGGVERDVKEGSKKSGGSGKGSSKSLSNSSSSSSSGSDNESLVVDKRWKEKDNASVSEEKSSPVSEEKTVLVSEEKPASDLPVSVDYSLAELTHSAEVAPAEKTVLLTETTEAQDQVISCSDVKPAGESDAEKLSPTEVPESSTVSVPEKIKYMVTPMPLENDKASPNMTEYVSKEDGSKVLPPSGVSVAETSKDAGSIKDSEIPEYSESQSLVAPPPRGVEKTYWFACCGILDVITGSRR